MTFLSWIGTLHHVRCQPGLHGCDGPQGSFSQVHPTALVAVFLLGQILHSVDIVETVHFPRLVMASDPGCRAVQSGGNGRGSKVAVASFKLRIVCFI